jgi:hypothetical protein
LIGRFTPTVDWWLAMLLFATAAASGSAYVRVFERSGARAPGDLRTIPARSMWFGQSEFGAAVALACGRGYTDPGPALTPGLSAFLTLKSDHFSCAELPQALPARPPNVTQRLYRYLMWSVAGVWAVRGISWSELWPLFGVLYGATVAVCYGLFRLGMGRIVSCAAALGLLVSSTHLGNLPGLRDYAKAPFILGLILIAAHLARRLDRPAALAALFGGVLGIGFGFRNDILIVLPAFIVVLLAWELPRDRRDVGVRLMGLAIAGVAFTVTAWPILWAYARGSNTGHVALLGLMTPFDGPLGIAGSVYAWGYAFLDGFANTVINSYTYRVYGHPVVYLSGEYDRAMIHYILQIARHWPADIIARAYSAVLKVVDFPFETGVYMDSVPFGIRNATVLRLYGWQTGALHVLEGTGIAAVALALCALSASSVRRAVLLLAGLLYFAGYTAIQFQPRHFFHLEFIAWWALGFLAQGVIAGELLSRPSRETMRRVAVFAAIALGILVLPLEAARWYQQRHMRLFLERYVDAAREPVTVQAIEAGDRTLLQAATLWEGRNVQQRVSTEYIVVAFSPAACSAISLPVTFRYDAPDQWTDYSLDLTLPLTGDHPSTEVFFPAYYISGSSRFTGVEVPRGLERCVQQVTRVRDLRPLPLLLNLTLTSNLEHALLYQTLSDWETSGPVPPRRVYTLPDRLPVTRATADSHVEPPPLSWRTAIVHDDSAGGWSIAGTPKGPRYPLLEFAAESRTVDDRFVVEGELERGGITIGLVRGETWADDGNVTISARGRFTAVLAPRTQGSYSVLFVNGLDASWFLRHASVQVAQLAGRFHVFNNVRILKAGWSSPTAVAESSIPPRYTRR